MTRANRCAFVLAVFCAATSFTPRGVVAEPLDQAFKRELAVLEEEKRSLEQALARGRKEAEAAENALEREIQERAATLTNLQSTNASFEDSFRLREERRQALANKNSIEELHRQIEGWLVARGEAKEHEASGPEALPELVNLALARIRRDGELRLHPTKEAFTDEGKAQQLPILTLGRVGALWWAQPPRPLLPTPDGVLRTVVGLASARISTDAGWIVEPVLVDPKRPPLPEAYARTGFREWMHAGGPLMWVILALGIAAVLVALDRVAVLAISTARWQRMRLALDPELAAAKWSDALQSGNAFSRFALAAPILAILARISRPRQELEERATLALLAAKPALFRRLSLLSVTASAAPLLGLLGTVTGMIGTFATITDHGTGDPRLLSGGISEALLTTQLGLAVAIPTLLARTGLGRWAMRLFERAESFSLDLIHRIEDQQAGLARPRDHASHELDHDDHDHHHKDAS